jgi:hypothetical protein
LDSSRPPQDSRQPTTPANHRAKRTISTAAIWRAQHPNDKSLRGSVPSLRSRPMVRCNRGMDKRGPLVQNPSRVLAGHDRSQVYHGLQPLYRRRRQCAAGRSGASGCQRLRLRRSMRAARSDIGLKLTTRLARPCQRKERRSRPTPSRGVETPQIKPQANGINVDSVGRCCWISVCVDPRTPILVCLHHRHTCITPGHGHMRPALAHTSSFCPERASPVRVPGVPAVTMTAVPQPHQPEQPIREQLIAALSPETIHPTTGRRTLAGAARSRVGRPWRPGAGPHRDLPT